MNYYNEWDKGAAAWFRELINNKLIPYGYVDERSITEVTPSDLEGFTQCHFFAGIGGGPLHSSWLEYQKALDCGQAHHLASRLALPVSLADLTTNDTLPLYFSGSSESASLNCYLESRLRQQLESTGSTLYSLTWKKKATPAGRQYCQRAASAHRIKESVSSLVRIDWPTPAVSAITNAVTMSSTDGRTKPNKLGWASALTAWPTPTANDYKGSGETVIRKDGKDRTFDRLDYATEQGIKTATRITASGQMLTGSDAGMESSGQLNPAHSRWLMGFPQEWDACAVTAMPSSRKSQRNS